MTLGPNCNLWAGFSALIKLKRCSQSSSSPRLLHESVESCNAPLYRETVCGDFVRCQLSHIEAKSPRIPFLLSIPGEIGEAEVRQRPFLCSEGRCRQQVPCSSHMLLGICWPTSWAWGSSSSRSWATYVCDSDKEHQLLMQVAHVLKAGHGETNAGTSCPHEFQFVSALPQCTSSFQSLPTYVHFSPNTRCRDNILA